MRVSGTSKSGSVAGAVAGMLREDESARLEAIGVKAVHNAVKSLVIARLFLENDGIIPVIQITSEKRTIKDSEATAIIFDVTRKK